MVLIWRDCRAYTRSVTRKPTKTAGALREWRIILVRAKGQSLGRIEAASAEEAIEKAAKLFSIPEAQRSRLIVQPVE
jgi:hypothetical protein